MPGLAGTVNLDINQNATFVLQIVWNTGGDSSTPIDNTGYKAYLQFRPAVNSSTVLFSGSDQNGIITLHGTSGQITVNIPWSQTTLSAMPFSEAVYDLVLMDTLGEVYRIIQGNVTVHPGVTVPGLT